jgi:hypothetical protein
MNLAEDDIAFIKAHLGEWLAEQSLGKPPAVYEIELRERMVRVEEELRHQRELMKQGFDLMEKRFEQVDSRFEQITRRIDRFMIWTLGLYVAGIGSVLAMIWHTSTP